MDFDAILIGGGLAGSTVAKKLAESGHKVLVLEKETRFKDRVRGENMQAWGVAAARRLGILDDLVSAGGIQPPFWTTTLYGQLIEKRDLRTTTPFSETQLNMFHPDMQEKLIQSAAKAGAEIIRGATVSGIDCGPNRDPAVTFESNGQQRSVSARLVIGADGRTSQARSWAGFEVKRNPDWMMIAGTRIDGTDVPAETCHVFFGNAIGTLIAPMGQQKARIYFVYPLIAGRRSLSGNDKVPEFLQLCQQAGAPASWFQNVQAIGPLAEFNSADSWVPSPVQNRVVLVGDAAAASDPCWGCGLALTMVDVEHLTNALCSGDDWNAALQRFAAQHDEYYGALHRILGWMTELFWTVGPEADARRAKVLPKMGENPTEFPDPVGLGPFGPSGERAGRLMMGLD